MSTVAGFPYVEVEFTADGAVHDGAQVVTLHDVVGRERVSDLIVISHGWNNDMAEARDLYSRFLESLRAVLEQHVVSGAAGRVYGVLAVLWPSKKFADEELIPGAAAALGSAVSMAFVERQLDRLKEALQAPEKAATLDRARALIPALPNSPRAQEEFADLVRSVLSATDVEAEDASGEFFAQSGRDLMDRLARPTTVLTPGATTGGAAAISLPAAGSIAGGAAGLGQTFSGALSAARNLLNYSTYYLMKERAGTVGRRGLNGVLRQLKALRPSLRVHLIGHSFGARVITAATDGPAGQAPTTFDTLVLLQAAFSHNAFAVKFDGSRDGAFRSVLARQKVRGPIVITHTRHDRAVGVAYPIASRLAGQDASGLGDENDRFGGLGRNGAQHTPERVAGALLPVGGGYGFEPAKVYNLHADSVIHDHSDIVHPEVAFAVVTALATT
jgi:hypothetical protein